MHRALSLANIHEKHISLPHASDINSGGTLGRSTVRNAEKVEMAACELLQTQQSNFYREGVFKTCPVSIKSTNMLWNYF
jgi:hypothetical protein